jgi:hypothetical protein
LPFEFLGTLGLSLIDDVLYGGSNQLFEFGGTTMTIQLLQKCLPGFLVLLDKKAAHSKKGQTAMPSPTFDFG